MASLRHEHEAKQEKEKIQRLLMLIIASAQIKEEKRQVAQCQLLPDTVRQAAAGSLCMVGIGDA